MKCNWNFIGCFPIKNRIITVILAMFLPLGIFAQVAVNTNGNLPDSSAMLDVQATGLGFLAPRMSEFQRPANPATGLIIYQTNNNPGYYYFDSIAWHRVATSTNEFWTKNENDIYYSDGNVGIGTNSPKAKLHLAGEIEVMRFESSSDPLISFYSGTTYKAWMQSFGDDFFIANRMTGSLRLRTSNVDRLVIEGNGNVVIGATSGAEGYRLSVSGKMACEEILIDSQGYWPDYVFDPKYNLLSIDEFEESIQKNKHLPGIPSASEVSENGGHLVGDVQLKLLEKIEELSLYIIELNQRVKELENENRAMKQ